MADEEKTSSDTGSGVESLLSLLGKTSSDTGTCSLENSYLHILEAVKSSLDTGTGVESSIKGFISHEDGSGLDAVIARALFGKEYPTGAIDLAKVLIATITGISDVGAGAEASILSLYRKKPDSGVGVDTSTVVKIIGEIGKQMRLEVYQRQAFNQVVYTSETGK